MRAAVPLFFQSIKVDNKPLLTAGGPLLIASNHPNSFLDAIIFDILFDLPVTSLARGDAFKSKYIFRLLRALKMLPVYRIREGIENLNTNYETFEACMELFRNKEAVLIFSEGLCVNEWHLRPLKKGTARLAFKAWDNKIPLRVLPAGINYSSFRKYGKSVRVHLGSLIEAVAFDPGRPDGINYNCFNERLKQQLEALVFEIAPADSKELARKFGSTPAPVKLFLALPALAGALLHAPLYWLAKLVMKIFFDNTDHYDSVMFGFLLLGYPFYVLLFFIPALHYLGLIYALSILLLLPLTAYCYTKYEIRKG
ncbi:MAG: 1-acyl-sn-glycerol-3-phosphate acyltransferase [Niabella sp.]